MASASLAFGCGDDSEAELDPVLTYDVEATTTMDAADPPLSKAQFVARMNETCREAWTTVHDNWDVYTGNQDRSIGERKRFEEGVRLSLLAGIDFHIFDNFRLTGAPAGEERAIEAIIGPFQAAVELGWKERWRAYSVGEIVPHFEIYNRRAHRYGLTDCVVDDAHLRPIAES